MNWIIKPLQSSQNKLVNAPITVSVPADKSITHRAIMLASLCKEKAKSEINNYLNAEDCESTINAMISLGVNITRETPARAIVKSGQAPYLTIEGVGLRGLKKPKGPINAGNSGTTTRLLAGILAAQDFESEIDGDESLRKRPMKRIIEPLEQMGAKITAREGNYLPMRIIGNPKLKAITYPSKIASAQVKSCVLFAGMFAKGKTTFIEPFKSRDHTENMLEFLGVDVEKNDTGNGVSVSLEGPIKELSGKGQSLGVPSDISSAAFFLVAGVLLSKTKLKVKDVGVNITRDGIIEILKNMGANISKDKENKVSGELVADLVVETSKLNGTTIGAEIMPRLIDEIPILALAATQATGKTIISGAQELRVKESDRLKAIADELHKMGAVKGKYIVETPDGLTINGPVKLHGAVVDSHKDHRIAMMLAVAALIAEGQTTIKDADCVNISFPNFDKILLEKLGVVIKYE